MAIELEASFPKNKHKIYRLDKDKKCLKIITADKILMVTLTPSLRNDSAFSTNS
jgi:hypothetical protein